MKKLISGFLASAFIFGSLSISAFASDPPITPYGALCGNCNIGEMQEEAPVYSHWETVDIVTCPDNVFWNDAVEERTVTYSWRCDHCGVSTSHTITETRTVHAH